MKITHSEGGRGGADDNAWEAAAAKRRMQFAMQNALGERDRKQHETNNTTHTHTHNTQVWNPHSKLLMHKFDVHLTEETVAEPEAPTFIACCGGPAMRTAVIDERKRKEKTKEKGRKGKDSSAGRHARGVVLTDTEKQSTCGTSGGRQYPKDDIVVSS